MRGDQLARQWQLIQRLAKSRAGVGLDELAEDLGCVRRTVYRDLDALMYAGFPVTSEKRDGKAFYRFLDGFELGDVPFTPDEILALAFGEDLLRTLEGTVFHDSIRSALGKIRAGLGPELTEFLGEMAGAFRVLPGPHKRYAEQRDVIATLNQAVLQRRRVEIEYRTGRTGQQRTRSIAPFHVWYHGGGLYVIGHDDLSDEIRTFAIDRIRSAEATAEAFEVPADFDFDTYTASSFGVVAEPAERVTVRFARERATEIAERVWHPSQKLHRNDDGSIELELEVGTGIELKSWILSFGPDAEVLAPPSLRADLEASLKQALARYTS
jgi:predicted DNA-binding transcriptional regulator YafY